MNHWIEALLQTPIPASKPAAAEIMDPRQANKALWKALDLNDLDGVRGALDAGGSLKTRRAGEPLIWRALANGQWDIAQMLVERGADPASETRAGAGAYVAIAGRDDPAEAERLKAWGVPTLGIKPDGFIDAPGGAPKLLQWWLEQGHMDRIIWRGSDPKDLLNWARVGLRGSEALRGYFNQAWQVDAHQPDTFCQAFGDYRGLTSLLWEWLAGKDEPELARRALTSGWAMLPDQDPCWAMARGGAWETLDWFLQVPALRDQMMSLGRQHPKHTWWAVARRNVPSANRMVALGFEVSQQDCEGSTLAHEVLAYPDVTRAMIQWLAQQDGDLLTQPDKRGISPLDLVRNPQTRADIEAATLGGATVKASAPARAPRL